jgi:diacylglycerol kinase (ATP)
MAVTNNCFLFTILSYDLFTTIKESNLNEMYLLLNDKAAGGTAKKKWQRIKNKIQHRFDHLKIVNTYDQSVTEQILRELDTTNNNKIIIAGGDGTINYFINKLMEAKDEKEIKSISIGVLGIGSSNDFCKPFNKESFINRVPCRINFEDAQLRDVGIIKYRSNNGLLCKYFLLNASIGVTAEANNIFNNPDKVLKFLKKYFTSAAIIYAAVKTIINHKNFLAQITFDPFDKYSFRISNLSIVKSPNFSGNLCYPIEANYQNGLYDVYLAHSMRRNQLINLLRSLSNKIFPQSSSTKYCKAPKIKVRSENDFLVEFDGEVISTNYAEFSILKEYLKVCMN